MYSMKILITIVPSLVMLWIELFCKEVGLDGFYMVFALCTMLEKR